LVVQIEDPNVKVSVDGDEVVIDGVGVQELRLKPGKHRWTAERNGTSSTQWVTIERGGKAIVRIQQLPPERPKNVGASGGSPTAGLPTVSPKQPRNPTSVPAGGLPVITPRGKPNLPAGIPATGLHVAEVIPHQPNYDGLAFQLPQNISRLYNGQPFEGPDGLHKFETVPSYLRGQRCATANRKGGRLMFTVNSLRAGSDKQRIWMLISRWETNTNSTRESGFAFDTRESLMKKRLETIRDARQRKH